eukprot:COSAG02_NODE_378_length_23535_cov_35.310164_11_plen_272_part_00
MASAPSASASDAALLRLARSLPTTGDGVLCSPNVRPVGDAAAAIGREPHCSDIPGDYCYLALGAAWKRAAPKLLAAAKAAYGCAPEVTADAHTLREMLAAPPGGGDDAVDRTVLTSAQALRCTFQTPPAPTGPHITIRSNLRPVSLLPSEDWRFRVVRAVSFTNPKLGKPSQWDSNWYCARWVALEVEWLGSCADKQRGGWPHVAIGSFGFRLPTREDNCRRQEPVVGARSGESTVGKGEGEGCVRKKRRKKTRDRKATRKKGKRRQSGET